MDRNQENAICPSCEQTGQINRLKFFYINLNEMVLKCSSSCCMFPFEKFIYRTVEDDSFPGNSEISSFSLKSEDNKMSTSSFPFSDGTMTIKTTNKFPDALSCVSSFITMPLLKINTEPAEIPIDIVNGLQSNIDINMQPNYLENKCKIELYSSNLNECPTSPARDDSKTQSTTLTISRYLESIRMRQKKMREANKISIKMEKGSKKLKKASSFAEIGGGFLGSRKNLCRPLDILKKIQRL